MAEGSSTRHHANDSVRLLTCLPLLMCSPVLQKVPYNTIGKIESQGIKGQEEFSSEAGLHMPAATGTGWCLAGTDRCHWRTWSQRCLTSTNSPAPTATHHTCAVVRLQIGASGTSNLW